MTKTHPIVGGTESGNYHEEGQDLAFVTINEHYDRVSHSPTLVVKGINQTTPPGSPSLGDAYLLASSSCTGDWTGQEKKVAVWYDGWWFRTMAIGEVFTDISAGYVYVKQTDVPAYSQIYP